MNAEPKSNKPIIKRLREGYSGDASVQAGDKLKFDSEFGTIEVNRPTENFPATAQLIPTKFGANQITLNVEFLYGIAKALGSDNVTLSFNDSLSPMIVVGTDGKNDDSFATGPFAILMPVRR